MLRKILIILIVVLAVLAGVYFFYVRPRVQNGQPVPNVLVSFFPKVTSSGDSFGEDTTADPTLDGSGVSVIASNLKQLTGRPVAGYTLFNVSTKVSVPSIDPKIPPAITTVTDYYVRYVSRVNGYVYEIKNNEIPLQVTNVLIPNIYEAFFAENNNTAILRFLRPDAQTIATYSVPVPPLNQDGTRTQAYGTYLPNNIYSVTVSPDQKSILRIVPDGTGVAVNTSTLAGKSIKSVYKSPFTSWLPQWNTSGIYLQTKAAATVEGFLYAIDGGARLRRILGNINGLTTSVSPSGTYVIYSESVEGGFSTKIFNTKTNGTTALNLDILPEKCTWLKNEDLVCAGNNTVANAIYPDAWYAGTTHFTDLIYRITPSSSTYNTLFDDERRSFDMVNVQVDEDQRYVYFIDKNTGILWRYKY